MSWSRTIAASSVSQTGSSAAKLVESIIQEWRAPADAVRWLAVEPIQNPRKRALRIRFGVCLVIASWLPIAQVTIWLTSPSSGQADRIRAVIWGIQVVVGLIGVAVAGSQTIQVAKSVGWRRAPGAVWRLIRSPNAPADPAL